MDAPHGKAPMQPGPPPILMAGRQEPLKEHAQRARRRRLYVVTAFAVLAAAVAVLAALR